MDFLNETISYEVVGSNHFRNNTRFVSSTWWIYYSKTDIKSYRLLWNC